MNINFKKNIKRGVTAVLLMAFVVSGALGTTLAAKAVENGSNESVLDEGQISSSERTVSESAVTGLSDEGGIALAEESEHTPQPSSEATSSITESVVESWKETEFENTPEARLFGDDDESTSYTITSAMVLNGVYDLKDVPSDKQVIVIDTGEVLSLRDSRAEALRVPLHIAVNENSGVEVAQGVVVGDIITNTLPGQVVYNIIVRGTASQIHISQGTVLKSLQGYRINVGAQESGVILGNIILAHDVTVNIEETSIVGVGALDGGVVKGDVGVANNIIVRSQTQTGIQAALGAYSSSGASVSKINNIITGERLNAAVEIAQGGVVVGVSNSIGNNIIVGRSAEIDFSHSGAATNSGVGVGASGSYENPGILNDITVVSSEENFYGVSIAFSAGVGIGLQGYGEINNITVGDCTRMQIYDGMDYLQTFIGGQGGSDGGTIKGDILVGDKVWLLSEYDNYANLGIGVESIVLEGDITIGSGLYLSSVITGVGVIPLDADASAGNISIGKNSTIMGEIIAVGAYSGTNTYTGAVGNITIGEMCYLETKSIGIGAIGKNNSTKSIFTDKYVSIITARLGIGGANGGIVNGSISTKDHVTIKSLYDEGKFTAIGAGYDERRFQDAIGQKVTGNIMVDGTLAIYYDKESHQFPMVNLLGNTTGKVVVTNGGFFQQQISNNIAEPVASDRIFVNQHNEKLEPYAVPLPKRKYIFTVPANEKYNTYNYTLNYYTANAELHEAKDMYIYLPKRTIDAIATLPAGTEGRPPFVLSSIGIQFNQKVVEAIYEKNEVAPVIKIIYAKNGQTVAEVELNKENKAMGIYSLGNGIDNTQDDVFFLPLEDYKLQRNKEYAIVFPPDTFKNDIGFMNQPQEIKRTFKIGKEPLPVSSSSSSPVSSSSKLPISSSTNLPTSSSDSQIISSSSGLPGSSSTSAIASSSIKTFTSPAPVHSTVPSSLVPASSSMVSSSLSASQSRSVSSASASNDKNETSASVDSVVRSASSWDSNSINNNGGGNANVLNQETLSSIIADGIPTFSLGENQIPLFGNRDGTWALANLMLALLGGLATLVLLIVNIVRSRKKNQKILNKGRRKIFLIVAFAASALNLLMFLLLQNMTELMVVFDMNTPVFLIVTVVQVVMLLLAKLSPPIIKEEVV